MSKQVDNAGFSPQLRELAVWKYELRGFGRQVIKMPYEFRWLTVQAQGRDICLWALVNPKTEPEDVVFHVISTGETFDYNCKSYIGTVQIGPTVYHIFMETDEPD